MNPLRLGTVAWCVLAILAVIMVLTDPLASEEDESQFVSVRADQRRVFPGLGDFSVSEATVEIQPARGAPVRIVAAAEGHQIMAGDELLGPADHEAVEGLWSTLRLATTMRAAPDGAEIRGGVAGSLRVRVSDKAFTVEFGDEVPGGAGRYATVTEGRESESWVVEPELRWPVEAEAASWIARQLSQAEAEQVTSISWADSLQLGRGEDGMWRVAAGAAPALLSTEAVDSRLERLLTTRLEPMFPRAEVKDRAWAPALLIAVEGSEGNVSLSVGGPCPGDETRRTLVDRGPGMVGCVPTDMIAPWPVADPREGFLESRLVAATYGQLRRVEQQRPGSMTLSRTGSTWRLAVQGDAGAAAQTVEVSEGEVYRWFEQLRDAEIAAAAPEDGGANLEASHQLVLVTDLGVQYRLDCGRREPDGAPEAWTCRRDGGPLLRVVGAAPDLAFDARTFEDRTLLKFRAVDVRALELRPEEGSTPAGVRTSLRSDFGVWRLEAPGHPDQDAALDEVRLEELLTTLSSLRADRWAVDGLGEVVRTINLSLGASEDGPPREIVVRIDDRCGCQVGEGVVGRLSTRDCEVVTGELLYDDPMRAWLRQARSVEGETASGDSIVARMRGEDWEIEGKSAAEAQTIFEALDALERWRVTGLIAADPEDAGGARWILRRDGGADVEVRVRPGVIQVAGQPWAYEGEARPREDEAAAE